MLKVLHIGEYVKGGVATYLHILFQAPAGEAGNYLLLARAHSDQAWELPADHVRFYAYERGLRCLPVAVRAVRRAVRDWQPDIVYCHSSWAGAFGRVALMGTVPRPRVLYNAHGWAFLRDTAAWKQEVYAWVERWLARHTDRIICVSRYEYEAALRRGLSEAQLRLVYSGLPESQEAPATPGQDTSAAVIRLLFIGRWDPQKGLDLLLEQFTACPRQDLRLYVLGAGVVEQGSARSQQLQQLVAQAKQDSRITFVGWVEHEKLASWYAACDAVVMPSRWEAFGLVAAEALQHARPVLASTRGALPELIHDGENGYLFTFDTPPAADTPTARQPQDTPATRQPQDTPTARQPQDTPTTCQPQDRTFSRGALTLGQLLARLDREELRRLRPAARQSFEQRFTAAHLWRNMMEIYRELTTTGGAE